MMFGAALDAIRAGKRSRRSGWRDTGTWIALQVPDEGSKMGLPYVYLSTPGGEMVPWTPSQVDLLADDWERVK